MVADRAMGTFVPEIYVAPPAMPAVRLRERPVGTAGETAVPTRP